jgi:hypothetical protein
MGEYIKYKGTKTKIGTCEDLYYTDYCRFSQAFKKGQLTQDEFNADPGVYLSPNSGCRFRFPFPDEDATPLGELGNDNYNRGLLITIERGETFATDEFPLLTQKYDVVSRSQPELVRHMVQVNPNNVMKFVDIEIIQQRLVRRDGQLRLVLVYRCPYSQERWRIEDKAEACHITEQISKRYIQTTDDLEVKSFWSKVNKRILKGYDPLPQT